LAKDEAKRDLMISALAEGRSVRTVAKAYGVSTNLVLAVKRKFAPQIETEKERLGLDCFDVARLAVERIRDEIDDMPKASLSIIAGVMIDKGQLLTGAPTARVRVERVDGVASVADYIAGLPAAVPVSEGEMSGEKGGAFIELGDGLRDATREQGESIDGQANGQAGDLKSHVSDGLPEVSGEDVADKGRNEGQNA
jgi:hypothetical protein